MYNSIKSYTMVADKPLLTREVQLTYLVVENLRNLTCDACGKELPRAGMIHPRNKHYEISDTYVKSLRVVKHLTNSNTQEQVSIPEKRQQRISERYGKTTDVILDLDCGKATIDNLIRGKTVFHDSMDKVRRITNNLSYE
jgi:hypothetical protein